MNITTHEDKKLTVQLDSSGFCIVCNGEHDTVERYTEELVDQFVDREITNDNQIFFETPYALLSSVSAGYDKSFGENLISKLKTLQN